MVDSSGIYKSVSITIVIWTVVSLLVIWPTISFGNSYMIFGLFIGMGITFLTSLSKWGTTQANCADYYRRYERYYAHNDLIALGVLTEERE
jgi:hypothetical protein